MAADRPGSTSLAAMADPFQDILQGNARYRSGHVAIESGTPKRRLAVVTCIDARIDPLEVLGLGVGDAKVLRNAGARVTDDVIRSLAVAAAALGVERIAVIQHTRCAMASVPEEEAARLVADATGADVSATAFGTIDDQEVVLTDDVAVLRASPLIPDSVTIAGFILDLETGTLAPTA